ncbi:hypothetical protein ACUOJS_26440, partial [Escherichia coli]
MVLVIIKITLAKFDCYGNLHLFKSVLIRIFQKPLFSCLQPKIEKKELIIHGGVKILNEEKRTEELGLETK